MEERLLNSLILILKEEKVGVVMIIDITLGCHIKDMFIKLEINKLQL